MQEAVTAITYKNESVSLLTEKWPPILHRKSEEERGPFALGEEKAPSLPRSPRLFRVDCGTCR